MEEVSKLNPQEPEGAIRNKVEEVIEGLVTEAFCRGVGIYPQGTGEPSLGMKQGNFVITSIL